jgi:hypothetical protein
MKSAAVVVLAISLLAGSSCGGDRGSGSVPKIRLIASDQQPDAAVVVVEGLSDRDLAALRGRAWLPDEWNTLLHVTIASDDPRDVSTNVPPMAGSYSVTASAIQFKPAFGFDPGRQYRVTFDLAQLPSHTGFISSSSDQIVEIVGRPQPPASAPTIVDHIYPSTDVVPANQLRLYVHFSAPMGLKGGLDYVTLLDDQSHQVADPFLPLDAEFWNADHTRFTVFFDPGRVKRGILPHEQMGRPLKAGHTYTLVVSREWRDAHGQPLEREFRRTFRVGPPDEKPLDPDTWRIDAPRAATRDPLTITFPEPLDHGLLQRAIAVTTAVGEPIAGALRIDAQETRWEFTPRETWKAGDYRIKALGILEDLAGNRIGRAFEVDDFERVDRQAEPDATLIAFKIAR